MPWNELTTAEELQALIENFAGFENACIVDIKYFSADRTNPSYPGDTSYENSIYASFISENPEIAGDPAISNIILKFTGIDHLNIIAYKGYVGKLDGICLAKVGEKIVWSTDPNFLDSYPVDNIPIKDLPSYIVADSVAWGYGIDSIEEE